MSSLNQQYKQSGSALSFKDWVFEQQNKGSLDLDLKKSNNLDMTGETTDTKLKLFGIPLIYVGLGLAAITITAIFLKRKQA